MQYSIYNIVCLLCSRSIWYYSKLEVNWTLWNTATKLSLSHVPSMPPKYENTGKFTATFTHILDAGAPDQVSHMVGLEIKCGVRSERVPLHSTKMLLPRLVSAQGSLQRAVCMTQRCPLSQTNPLPGRSTLLLILMCFIYTNKYGGQMLASLFFVCIN